MQEGLKAACCPDDHCMLGLILVSRVVQVRLMREFGYVLGNLDATIILQRPKLSPHKEKIRANLCQLLGADPSVVNIKVQIPNSHSIFSVPKLLYRLECADGCIVMMWASCILQVAPCKGNDMLFMQAKTHEKVDSLGENRSIAVHAVCMLIREDLMS